MLRLHGHRDERETVFLEVMTMLAKITRIAIYVLLLHAHAFSQPYVSAEQGPEWIHVVTNGAFFVTAETLKFNVNVLSASQNTPSTISSIAYVELVDEGGKPAAREKVLLQNGRGTGDLKISSNLLTGNYTIVAYTRWMRNFSRDHFFRKTITLVNPSMPAPLLDEKNRNENDFQVEFFPEGGNFVYGIPNKVGYRVQGTIDSVSGRVLNDSSEFAPPLVVLSPSTGYFFITPQIGETPKIALTIAGRVIIREVPDKSISQIALNLKEDTRTISLVVEDFRKMPTTPVHYQLTRHGSLLTNSLSGLTQTNKKDSIVIDKERLPDGVYTFLVNDEHGTLLAFRKFAVLEQKAQTVVIKTERKEYSYRSKIQIEVMNNDSIPAALTVSVRLAKNELEKMPASTRTSKEHPALQSVNDNLLITTVPRQPDHAHMKWLPDLRGQLISVRIAESESDRPLANKDVFISGKGRDSDLSIARTDSSGRLFCNVPQIGGESGLFITWRDRLGRDFTVVSDNEFLEDHADFTPPALQLDTTLRREIIQRYVYSQIEKAYDRTPDESGRPRNFYGTPERIYYLDDFTRFPTMEDVFREFIQEVVVRKRGEKYSVVLVNSKTGFRFQNEPLILIDGMPVLNTDELIAYDPLLVESIDIVTTRYVYSSLQTDGIISLHTYKQDAPGLSLERFTALPYLPFVERNAGLRPDEDPIARPARMPDYRTTLYWAPTIDVPAKSSTPVTFFASDVSGTFVFEVTGVNANGKRIHTIREITVRPPQGR